MGTLFENLGQDVRQALRRMAKAPALTAAVVVTLAVAIGLDTAAFSLVNALLLRPLPVERPGELAHVYTASREGLLSHGPLAFPDYEELRDRSEVFSSLAAYAHQPVSLRTGDRSELLMAEVVTGEYFGTLGVEAARGRLLRASDDRPGAPPVAVLGHGAWRRRFGGEPGVIGRPIRLAGHPFTVVGVAPAQFSGLTRGLAAELWLPVHAADRLPSGVTVGFGELTPGASRLEDRSRRWIWTVGRLRPGGSVSAARAELEAVGRRLAAAHPATHRRRTFTAEAAEEVRLLPGVDRALRSGSAGLLALAGLVLLVAASNVANLLLARAAGRRREIVTRLSLGAGRRHLARQLLVESLVLALGAGAAGLLLAASVPRLLGALAPALPWPVEVTLDLPLDGRVLLFALGVSAGTAVLFGLAPLLEAGRTDLAGALRGEGSTPAVRRRRLAGALVVAQVAVSVVLLVGLGLTVRSLVRAHGIDPGLEPAGVVTATLAPELQGYPPERVEETFRRIEEELAALPRVRSTAAASHLPLTFGLRQGIVSASERGAPGAGGAAWIDVDEAAVGPGYFENLRIPVLAGRGFTEGDRPGAPLVAVVNQALAERLWPGRNAVGRTLRMAGGDGAYRVVGVARDGRYRTLGEPRRPFLYRALAQHPVGTRTVVARTEGDPGRLLGPAERVIRAVDPTLPVLRLRTYEEALADSLLLPRAAAGLFGLFALLAAGLAALGVHGVLAHAAARRTREIGVRMALGASRRDVVALILIQGARLTATGLVLGLAAALLLGRGLRSVLYGVGGTDPLAFTAAAVVFTAVALLASWLPARRAGRLQPAEVLRR